MANPCMKEEDTKMLGAKVPSSIYWKFKEIAANRGERMEEAILNAALLYVDLTPSEKLATGGDKK